MAHGLSVYMVDSKGQPFKVCSGPKCDERIMLVTFDGQVCWPERAIVLNNGGFYQFCGYSHLARWAVNRSRKEAKG